MSVSENAAVTVDETSPERRSRPRKRESSCGNDGTIVVWLDARLRGHERRL
jgi:hypothetical protein